MQNTRICAFLQSQAHSTLVPAGAIKTMPPYMHCAFLPTHAQMI